MPNCSNCGRGLDGEPKVCPSCGWKTRLGSPGPMGAGPLQFLVGFLCIAGVLFAILYPVFGQAKESALSSADLSYAKFVAMSMDMYCADHEDKFPPMKSSEQVADLLTSYMPNSEIRDESVQFALSSIWNTEVSGVDVAAIETLNDVWLLHNISSKGPWNTVAFLDGHVKGYRDESSLAKVLAVKPKIFKRSNKP